MLISTHALPQSQRYDFWHQIVNERFVALDLVTEKNIRAELLHDRVSDIDVMKLNACRHTVSRNSRQIRKDGGKDEFFLFSLQLKGNGYLEQDDRSVLLQPGDFILFDSTRPYRMGFDDDFEKLVLRIPRMLLKQHVTAPERLCAYKVSGQQAIGSLLYNFLTSLEQLSELPNEAQSGVSGAIIQMVAGALQCMPQNNEIQINTVKSYHLKRIKKYIELNLAEPELSVATIAAYLEMSVSSLYRIFEGESMPLAQYIWIKRLEFCCRDLENKSLKHKPISQIAFEWGFTHGTHFSRSFKKQFGLSPKVYRERVLVAKNE
ncbi:TPA: transcriptional regulator FeaR [Raoultella planticola]|uniref:transcriptional regulator FeaR n=1 Tax=Raoultella planticola TaxID=575 RepID=UPI001A1D2312|nr:transcriptional regulator FeaR [Raoultella planticola]HAT1623133.1 transcriptional regulator FeaR [Raoultella planticola]HAT1644230.1 transcriptional regulator FeaR [Raoultella planticola]